MYRKQEHFYFNNGFSVRFEQPSKDDAQLVTAKSRATLYDAHGRMIDYLLESFSVQNTKACREVAVRIYEGFRGVYF